MKSSTHYICGNAFFSYNVTFFPLVFRNYILSGTNKNFLTTYAIVYGERDNEYYTCSRYLSIDDIAEDIKKPINCRVIFTATTIRHFNYYMGLYGISNAYRRLKDLLNIK